MGRMAHLVSSFIAGGRSPGAAESTPGMRRCRASDRWSVSLLDCCSRPACPRAETNRDEQPASRKHHADHTPQAGVSSPATSPAEWGFHAPLTGKTARDECLVLAEPRHACCVGQRCFVLHHVTADIDDAVTHVLECCERRCAEMPAAPVKAGRAVRASCGTRSRAELPDAPKHAAPGAVPRDSSVAVAQELRAQALEHPLRDAHAVRLVEGERAGRRRRARR